MTRGTPPRYNPAVPNPMRPETLDKFREECALFGIYGTSDAAAHTALGLHALQHRGQEAYGIVTFDGRHFQNHRAAGLVGDIFGEQSVIETLKGYAAIGHNRYATTGGSSDRNIQPIFADFDFGGLALAHNGNLTNAYLLRKELVRMGCLFQSTTDTEVINHLIARSNYSTVVDRVIDALGKVKGAYSLLMLTNEALLGVRDPMGIRPLCIGRLEDAWIVTSESVALDILGARFVRDVEPGEIVIVDGNGLRSIKPWAKQPRRFCVFEHIYFARPDSKIEGVGVYEARKKIGMELAKESGVPADVIIPVPDSGVPAALGYAQQSPASKLGAYHGAEMAYAYGTLDVLNRFGRTRAWTDEDRRFSDAMMGYWVNFARTGNPNGEGLPAWREQVEGMAVLRSQHPADDGSSRLLVQLGDGQVVESVLLPRGGLCVSTQVGCAVGCVFCMTGKEGLIRQITSGEIVAQVARTGVSILVVEQFARTVLGVADHARAGIRARVPCVGHCRLTVTDLRCVKLSSMPSSEYSRPMPLCL